MSELPELPNILLERPDYEITGGRTIVAKPKKRKTSPDELLENVRSVWKTVATWGRWVDEVEGSAIRDPTLEELPSWFKAAFGSRGSFQFWYEDLFSRDWTWWSSAIVGERFVKFDFEVASLPTSFWTVEFVIAKAHGRILYSDSWIDSQAVQKIV
jgi:hypothetical protein